MSAATLSKSELFRSVNEQINMLGFAFLGFVDFVCECEDEMCTGVMRMTHEEYDAVRSRPGLFAAHTRVANRRPRFMVVEVDAADEATSREAEA